MYPGYIKGQTPFALIPSVTCKETAQYIVKRKSKQTCGKLATEEKIWRHFTYIRLQVPEDERVGFRMMPTFVEFTYLYNVFKAACKFAFSFTLEQVPQSSYLSAYTCCYVLYNTSFGQTVRRAGVERST